MKTIGVYEAKTHLAQLLNEVAKGETIVITKHGEEIAKLVPIGRAKEQEIRQAVYDAAYLDLAIRKGFPIATLDQKLRVAAQNAQVEILTSF